MNKTRHILNKVSCSVEAKPCTKTIRVETKTRSDKGSASDSTRNKTVNKTVKINKIYCMKVKNMTVNKRKRKFFLSLLVNICSGINCNINLSSV